MPRAAGRDRSARRSSRRTRRPIRSKCRRVIRATPRDRMSCASTTSAPRPIEIARWMTRVSRDRGPSRSAPRPSTATPPRASRARSSSPNRRSAPNYPYGRPAAGEARRGTAKWRGRRAGGAVVSARGGHLASRRSAAITRRPRTPCRFWPRSTAARDDYATAEPMMKEAVGILERTLGAEYTRASRPALIRPGRAMHSYRGDLDRARGRARTVRSPSANGRSIPEDFARIALGNNLGGFYVGLKEYDTAASRC